MTTRQRLRDYTRQLQAGYSYVRMLDASGKLDRSLAPNEMAYSDEIAHQCGVKMMRASNSFFVPAQRDMTIATASSGGYLASTAAEAPPGVPAASDDFLSLCTVISPVPAAAQQIGRFSAMPSVTVLANEASTISEDTPVTARALLSPSNAGTYVEATRHWVLLSERGAASLVRLTQNALKNHMQTQICEGSGSSGQVTGLTVDSSITNASGSSLTWATTLAAMAPVEAVGGDSPLTWVVTSAAAKLLRARAGVAGGEAIMDRNNKIGGYRAVVIGGTTSSFAIFGRWQDLIVYQWTPIEVSTNPYAGFQQGIIGVRGWISFNAGPQVAASFSTITSIT